MICILGKGVRRHSAPSLGDFRSEQIQKPHQSAVVVVLNGDGGDTLSLFPRRLGETHYRDVPSQRRVLGGGLAVLAHGRPNIAARAREQRLEGQAFLGLDESLCLGMRRGRFQANLNELHHTGFPEPEAGRLAGIALENGFRCHLSPQATFNVPTPSAFELSKGVHSSSLCFPLASTACIRPDAACQLIPPERVLGRTPVLQPRCQVWRRRIRYAET
ncbi:uncharacterized protein CIMG_13271 [Coccidioides immitis RS]|uniref:Uncharacterized protein n=1 Tax=Coccidioides immitis (strain RS) TaxID=246410 RepID=J3K4R4_COCIM|nr:uncharacterized protein CIMG_13271 [Coccidioides immitis RS]EAS29322.3 hypothetical protein CIMG_13271 [Coccidioides immitis RS]